MAIDREFELELERLLNKHSVDVEVECPDFLLAESVMRHLLGLKATIKERDTWRGRRAAPPLTPPVQVD